MNFEQPNPAPQIIDLSNDFIRSPFDDFQDLLRKNRNCSIVISVDLSNVNDKDKFVSLVRLLKSVNANYIKGQKRTVTVRCTREQMLLDSNAFQSGVIFEEAT